MLYGERTRRQLNWTTKGVTGTIVYVCDWSDVDPVYDTGILPIIGGSWSVTRPYLRCVDISMQEIDGPSNPLVALGGFCEITTQFSTERELVQDWYDWSFNIGGETMDATRGWTWDTAGTVVEQDIPTTITTATYTLTVRNTTTPAANILSAINRVNSADIICTSAGCTFAAGTLRFDGANTDASFDLSGAITSCNTVYSFTWREMPWNYVWREPLQAVDGDNIPLVWQDIDSTKDNYSTDDTLVGTPMWVSGTAGSGDWDTPIGPSAETRYEAVNLMSLLGLVA